MIIQGPEGGAWRNSWLCHDNVNPLTLKISLVILLTVCYTLLLMLHLRIWYWINF